MDMVVATNDNIEIVAALTEIKLQILLPVHSERHANVLKQNRVNVIIKPEQEAGMRTALLAANPNFAKYSMGLQELGDNFVMGTTSTVYPEYFNKSLKDCKFIEKGLSVVLIKKKFRKTILPSGFTMLQSADLITILGKVNDVVHAF